MLVRCRGTVIAILALFLAGAPMPALASPTIPVCGPVGQLAWGQYLANPGLIPPAPPDAGNFSFGNTTGTVTSSVAGYFLPGFPQQTNTSFLYQYLINVQSGSVASITIPGSGCVAWPLFGTSSSVPVITACSVNGVPEFPCYNNVPVDSSINFGIQVESATSDATLLSPITAPGSSIVFGYVSNVAPGNWVDGTVSDGANSGAVLLLSPVPEPSTLIFVSTGLLGLLGFRLKRHRTSF